MSDQPQSFTWEDVQEAISTTAQKTRDEMQEKHEQEMETLRSQVSGGVPILTVPEHSGGPGGKMAPTWSLAEQTAAREAAFSK